MTDMMGKEIGPGDVVAYPVRFSSSMWMQVSLVGKVEEDRIHVYVMHDSYTGCKGPSKRTYPVVCLNRVVKVDMTEEEWRAQE